MCLALRYNASAIDVLAGKNDEEPPILIGRVQLQTS
jgi:hypothetical protein